MKVPAPRLFERLRVQTHIRRLVTEYGEQEAWDIITHAIELELKRKIHAKSKVLLQDPTR